MAEIAPRPDDPEGRRQRWANASWLPSWLLSAVIHAGLAVLLGLLMHSAPRGASLEPTRDVGIALVQHTSSGEEFFTDGGGSSAADAQPFSESPSNQQAADPLAELAQNPAAVSISDPLPSGAAILGPGSATGSESGGGGAVGSLTQGSGPNKGVKGGRGKTSVFGVPGEGSSFVYVFDRSGSMGGSGRSPLQAAQSELITSLDSLDRIHQFQIIFYNQQPYLFNPAGGTKLSFADDHNKEMARRFVLGITADGYTDHLAALKLALSLHPDVVFFLTDADLPELSPGELLEIRRRNRGTSINTIEFGLGPQVRPDNFLQRLADQNGGRHGYVDISRFNNRR